MVKGRHRRGKTARWLRRRLHGAGALLLAVSACIHLDLYLTGYRSIPTIGWLFLVQFIVALVLREAALVTHSWLAAAASAGFALSTLGAYLLAVWFGLFGFKEIRTRAGIAAGLIEVAAFAMSWLWPRSPPVPCKLTGRSARGIRILGVAEVSRVAGDRRGRRRLGGRPGPARRRRGQRWRARLRPPAGARDYLEDHDGRRRDRGHQRRGPARCTGSPLTPRRPPSARGRAPPTGRRLPVLPRPVRA